MFNGMLIATTAVVGLAGAAHAWQIPSADTMCAQPNVIPAKQVVCSSPLLRTNAQRDFNALIPPARSLGQPEEVALLQTVARRSNENMTYCKLAIARPPQLPLSKATEDCIADRQDFN